MWPQHIGIGTVLEEPLYTNRVRTLGRHV
jgi:hypothetical protein